MRRVLLITFLILIPQLSFAQASVEERRIEEEKRQSLKPSEPPDPQQKESSKPSPLPEKILISNLATKREFFQELLSKKVAYLSDCVYTITVLLNNESRYTDFNAQYAYLKSQGILSPRNRPFPSAALRRGEMAYMFYKALKIKGGLWLKLFGPSERYAHKELIFERIMAVGSNEEYVSGKELVVTFIEAAEYLSERE